MRRTTTTMLLLLLHFTKYITIAVALGTVLGNGVERSESGGSSNLAREKQLVTNCTVSTGCEIGWDGKGAAAEDDIHLQRPSNHIATRLSGIKKDYAVRTNFSKCHNCSNLILLPNSALLLLPPATQVGSLNLSVINNKTLLSATTSDDVDDESLHVLPPPPVLLHKRSAQSFSRQTRKSSSSSSLSWKRQKTRKGKARKKLIILGLFELTRGTHERPSGRSEISAAQLALSHINEKNIVEDYELVMHTNDTKCDSGVGMDAFYHAIYTKKDVRMIALLGTACSEVTERLAKIVPFQHMVQVSFGSTSPSLSDRHEFPLFSRTVAPVCTHDDAIVALFHHFSWDEVTFFTKNENRYTMPANHLVREMENANITCKAAITFSLSDLQDQLNYMKEKDSRIIIASFGLDIAARIFCEIYKNGMFGKDYAWILLGQPETLWWREGAEAAGEDYYFSDSSRDYGQENSTNGTRRVSTVAEVFMSHLKVPSSVDCKIGELTTALERTLIIDRYNFIGISTKSDFGMTPEEFHKSLKNNSNSPYAPETYDAMWTIALGLDRVRRKFNYTLDNLPLDEDGTFAGRFMEEIKQTSFLGISGPVNFSGSDRVGTTSIMQIQGGHRSLAGLFEPLDSILNLSCSGCGEIRWHKNQVPIARREFRVKIIRVENSPYIIVAAVASFGIVLAAAFLAFNLYHRKLKYIKLSSPRLNNMVIIGCIFAYVAVILLGCDFGPEPDGKHFAYICTVRAYLLSTGFSLAFGAMFAKTYRVHRIFTRCHGCLGVVKNKLLRDTQLMTLVMALLVIDCLIVSSWAIFDPMHRNLKNLTIQDDPNDRSVVYQLQIEVCTSQHGHVWLSVLYGYKSLLLVVGVYMAWETRHVKIQALNDSNYIGLSVYVVVLTSVLGVSLANLVSDKVTLSFISVTSLILISTTVTLCLLFLPKIHAIVYSTAGAVDPVVESMGLKIEFNTRRLMVEDTKESLFRAEVQNRVYKRQIESIDVQIKRMERLLAGGTESKVPIPEQDGPGLEPVKKAGAPVVHVTMDPCSSLSSEDTESQSEIYTIYLHGPRFIIPISLFNFNTNTNITSVAAAASEARAVATAIGITTNSRSSWPNSHSQLTPSNGLIATKYYFSSEPKLLSDESEIESIKQQQQSHSADNVDHAEGRAGGLNGRGSDNTLNYQRHSSNYFSNKGAAGPDPNENGDFDSNPNGDIFNPDLSNGDRKNSSTSCGSKQNNNKHTSFLLSVFRHPLSYLTGIISSGNAATSAGANPACSDRLLEPGGRLDGGDIFDGVLGTGSSSARTENCKHFRMDGRDSQKFSSVPDLWAVRTSPLVGDKRKKASINSDSVIDANPISLLDRCKANSVDPVLTLTATSDESPYL